MIDTIVLKCQVCPDDVLEATLMEEHGEEFVNISLSIWGLPYNLSSPDIELSMEQARELGEWLINISKQELH